MYTHKPPLLKQIPKNRQVIWMWTTIFSSGKQNQGAVRLGLWHIQIGLQLKTTCVLWVVTFSKISLFPYRQQWEGWRVRIQLQERASVTVERGGEQGEWGQNNLSCLLPSQSPHRVFLRLIEVNIDSLVQLKPLVELSVVVCVQHLTDIDASVFSPPQSRCCGVCCSSLWSVSSSF